MQLDNIEQALYDELNAIQREYYNIIGDSKVEDPTEIYYDLYERLFSLYYDTLIKYEELNVAEVEKLFLDFRDDDEQGLCSDIFLKQLLIEHILWDGLGLYNGQHVWISKDVRRYISSVLELDEAYKNYFRSELVLLSKHINFNEISELLPWPEHHRKYISIREKWKKYSDQWVSEMCNDRFLNYGILRIRRHNERIIIESTFPEVARSLYEHCYRPMGEWESMQLLNSSFVKKLVDLTNNSIGLELFLNNVYKNRRESTEMDHLRLFISLKRHHDLIDTHNSKLFNFYVILKRILTAQDHDYDIEVDSSLQRSLLDSLSGGNVQKVFTLEEVISSSLRSAISSSNYEDIISFIDRYEHLPDLFDTVIHSMEANDELHTFVKRFTNSTNGSLNSLINKIHSVFYLQLENINGPSELIDKVIEGDLESRDYESIIAVALNNAELRPIDLAKIIEAIGTELRSVSFLLEKAFENTRFLHGNELSILIDKVPENYLDPEILKMWFSRFPSDEYISNKKYLVKHSKNGSKKAGILLFFLAEKFYDFELLYSSFLGLYRN